MKKTPNLKDIRDQPVRPRYSAAQACFDAGALNRVLQKIKLAGDRLCNMPDLEFAVWIDSLSRAEFLEYMMLSIPIRDR
ncbi:hypothetical protein BZM27_43825 [Paraburkholderia steynii]|uniref:Uncharacterized protein n=1 Tax=Paraburkholderia steynii TaxID=1245441 RepID=A0A4R0XDH0_9BURK|nr:hypothetical protein BZM27_43825 [Paraburkholderia steynii]